ncbi:MAG: pyruvate dehydrogenase (acetyl-transferring), homodimeric type [Candidatus Nanopelagicales bacterium]
MDPASLPSQFVDTNPEETSEWIDSLDAVIDREGPQRARAIMLNLLRRSAEKGVSIPTIASTDYINTIPPEREPWFPGDEFIEKRIRAFIRWNAAIMVHRAQKYGVGGHISTYASSASLYEVGFNHFFRGHDAPGGADQVFFQGHAAPGMYARAYLEGRLTEAQLDGFRREVSNPAGGLSSYPHPRLMPEFWQFPTVSMGLGPLHSIYQARFNRYLHARGFKDTSDQHVWAFLGDGEMDEPESISGLTLAARENLDNLTFVINCNLQRLDGPVRGNGKIIQELESLFRGAGWNVIKVIWGRSWDPLLAKDNTGALIDIMNTTPDGDFQTYKSENGAFIREHFFGKDPRTKELVSPMSDNEIWELQRGGHDYHKLYAAYRAALEHKGQPTVILAKTIKGWTLGSHFEGKNATHQMKKLTLEEIKTFRDRLYLEIPDSALQDEKKPPYYHPGNNDPIIEYMMERRKALGGFLPERRSNPVHISLPGEKAYESVKKSSGKQAVATTMAFVRLLKDLMKDPEIGKRFVPVIPDEARTFGMDSFFPTAKIYSPQGMQYTSVDRELFLAYKESETGQILHEGINEAGSVASWTAAATSYATHSEIMIPIYIFYSMFGFQRTGDQFWLAMDQMAKGFVIGATAGRTTLTGEGLQHNDGQSQLLASTNPAVVAYDPAFGFEIAHIVKDALRRMYGDKPENIYYYLTVYNEPYIQPEQPENLDVEGLLKGIYLYSKNKEKGVKANLLASGVSVPWALEAQEILKSYGVSADVYSVTSWNELRRDGLAADRFNLLNPDQPQKQPFLKTIFKNNSAPIVAVSDWMRAVQDQIRQFIDNDFTSLGADGWGLSDTRGALRSHFAIDAQAIAFATILSLVNKKELKSQVLEKAKKELKLNDPQNADHGSTAGDA